MTELDSQFRVELTPLLRTATTPGETSGPTTIVLANKEPGDQFSWPLGTVLVPGDANPITEADGELSGTLSGIRSASDRFCGELQGKIAKPFVVSLDGPGDSCLIQQIPEEGSLPAAPSAAQLILSLIHISEPTRPY